LPSTIFFDDSARKKRLVKSVTNLLLQLGAGPMSHPHFLISRTGSLVFSLLTTVVAAGAAAAAEQPGVVSSEFVYEHAPFPECHASTIAQTQEGLVAAWFGGTREKNKDVGIWTSLRGK